MGKIVAKIDMSLDGVFDHVDEWLDRDDMSLMRVSDELIFAADAVLIGRVTYEFLSQYWLAQQDDRGFAARLNSIPKYVVSRTLHGELDWNSTVIDSDVVESVAALRDRHRLIVSYGFGELAATLIEHGLLDELLVGVHPHIQGGDGLRLTSPMPLRLRMIDSRVLASGVTVTSYTPR